MSFDPIQERRTQKYTRAELKEFWQGSGVVAQRLLKENPALYKELHDAGERVGVVGKSMAPNPQPYVKNYAPEPKQYSAGELSALRRHSEAEVRTFFADAKKANEVFTSDRNLYEEWRDSGVSFGLFKAREVPYQPVKHPAPEPLHRVSDLLCDESHIPRGSELPWSQVEQLINQKLSRERDAQEAVTAKAESDGQAELAKLTAAQQLEQAERDRKQRDLDRLAELIAPKPPVVTEPGEVLLQRELAKEKAKVAG